MVLGVATPPRIIHTCPGRLLRRIPHFQCGEAGSIPVRGSESLHSHHPDGYSGKARSWQVTGLMKVITFRDRLIGRILDFESKSTGSNPVPGLVKLTVTPLYYQHVPVWISGI